MKRSLTILGFMVLAGIPVLAQQASVGLSPVPIWPPRGVLPSELDGRYVFFDPGTGEALLAFPANLGTPGFAQNPGRLKIIRILLQRNVQPIMRVELREQEEGTLEYEYTVRNGPGAKLPVMVWNLVLPEISDSDRTETPDFWGSGRSRSRISIVRDTLSNQETGGLLSWYTNDPRSVVDLYASAIHPGETMSGYKIITNKLPGFTNAYFRGGEMANVGFDVAPDIIREQLVPVLDYSFNSQVVVTLAPKYPADTHPMWLVRDFYQGIEQLVGTGQLDATSEFVREVRSALENYLYALGESNVERPEDFVGPSLQTNTRQRHRSRRRSRGLWLSRSENRLRGKLIWHQRSGKLRAFLPSLATASGSRHDITQTAEIFAC